MIVRCISWKVQQRHYSGRMDGEMGIDGSRVHDNGTMDQEKASSLFGRD